MIELKDVTKYYSIRGGYKKALDQVTITIRKGDVLGVMGHNGAGKSTLIRILGGVEMPSSGSLRRTMSVSWPLAFGGAFQGSLSGDDNLRFVCRVYGVDYAAAREYVQEFAELGRYLGEPVKTYSTGMRSRFAFAVSMAIHFDCYLVDEIIAVGDARFHAKCHEELFSRNKDSTKIIVSHSPQYLGSICSAFAVLANGRLEVAHDFEHANALYQSSTQSITTA